jgi:hypothetical protein
MSSKPSVYGEQHLDLHLKDTCVGAADFNIRVGIVHADPLGTRCLSVGIRAQQDMAVFRNGTRDSL